MSALTTAAYSRRGFLGLAGTAALTAACGSSSSGSARKTTKLRYQGSAGTVTPPELAADLVENGITMAGGGSLLRGLTAVVQKATGLETRLAEDPLTCVARGTCIYLEHIEEWKTTLENDLDV